MCRFIGGGEGHRNFMGAYVRAWVHFPFTHHQSDQLAVSLLQVPRATPYVTRKQIADISP
jgi:hypothetical protein